MRTRNQAKRQHQSTDTLADTSREGRSKVKRVTSRGSPRLKKQENSVHHCDPILEIDCGSKRNENQDTGARDAWDTSVAEGSRKDPKLYPPSNLTVGGGSFQQVNPDLENEMDEEDWEDGLTPNLSSRNDSDDMNKDLTIEFDASPEIAKRKPIRRASAEDKELAELVHRVHLLCLLGRGRLIDSTCSDPLIQASLLSLLPMHLLKISEVTKLTANALAPLVNWFHDNFHIKSPSSGDKSFHSALACALETREGSLEEVAALSVALFRALNLSTRFVSILDAASLKPDADKFKVNHQEVSRASRGIFNSSTVMVDRQDQNASSPVKHTACDDKENAQEKSVLVSHKNKVSNRNTSQQKSSPNADQSSDKRLGKLACKEENDIPGAWFPKRSEGSKRKGDIEFEMQLEMALSATADGSSESNVGSNVKDLQCTSLKFSPLKRLKRIKSEESSSSSQGISTAIGSKKIGAPMYWAEVYCGGENLTGRWVHIDAVSAIIDGEQKVEAAAAACKTSLRYVVAFAGQGAKDVTRRYCAKWYRIATQRVNSTWWDAVLAPLKALESGATGSMINLKQEVFNEHRNVEPQNLCDRLTLEVIKENGQKRNGFSSVTSSPAATRNSLEDMELETKALTEPLPTNQQAYRSHPLYALERWLTKYQTLHPKGPILGFCSGHPVYPRSCVQTLHTKERWLQEGLQVKGNELPVKVLKRSSKLIKSQVPCADDYDERDCEGPGGTSTLYGKWQTEPLCLPRAVNGIVPKNERGQVDVWSEKCLPPGTVHLGGLPRVFEVAKRLEVDYAPAMVGFEFRNGRSFPIYDGIVVCAEFKDAVLEAYAEQKERKEAENRKRDEMQAIRRWYQLLSSIITRQRLKNRYVDGPSSHTSNDIQKSSDKSNELTDKSLEEKQNSGLQTDILDIKPEDVSQMYTEDHEHVFSTYDQSFDEKTSTRIKRCCCGFSIQVEEL